MTIQAPNERDSRRLLGVTREASSDTFMDSSVNGNAQLELIEDSDPPAKPLVNKYALRYAVAASITSIVLGCEIGVMSETAAYIKKDQKIISKHVDVQIVILYVLSLLGSVMAAWTSDRIGRRYTIVLVGFLFFVGPLLMGFASNNFFVLLGRFVAHVGVGYTLMIAPVYVSEVSPASSRGFFTSFPEVSINFGIVLGHLCNYFFSNLESNGWIVMLCTGAISLVLLTIAVLTMPESPRWLIMQGRLADAKCILSRISNSEEEAALSFERIMQAAGIPAGCTDDVVNVPSTEKGVWWDLLLHPTPSVYHMLACAVGIHVFRQACGIDTVLLYGPHVFEKAGVTSSNKKLLWIVAVEFVKTVFIVIATLLIDWAGRRRLLLSSIGGMIVSLISLGTCLIMIDQRKTKHIDQRDWKHMSMWVDDICITSLFFYVVFFAIGMGPITSVYNSEIFPLKLRAQGCAIGFAANQLASALVSFVFLLLYKATTLGGATFLFVVGAIIAWIFFFIMMPETKGRTLEEMGQFFGEFFRWRFTTREIEMPRTTGRRNRGNDS